MPDTHTRTQHTPGPWAIGDVQDDVSPYPVLAAGIPVANVPYRGPCEAQDWADARLIAAAPDLLAALEQIVDAYENGGEGDFLSAMQAIRKARGEE